MRIALVSPYSWTYPGGVTRHVEALAAQFLSPDTMSASSRRSTRRSSAQRLHRGARPRSGRSPTTSAARPHGRLPLQRRGVEPRLHARRRHQLRRELPAAASTSCTCTSPSRRSPGGTRCAPSTRHSSPRSTATPTSVSRTTSRTLRRTAAAEPPARAHRRLARRPRGPGAASTAGATAIIPNGVDVRRPRRAVHGHTRRQAAADRVHRPGRRAQGPAGPAARLRGAARARRRRASRHRRRPRTSRRDARRAASPRSGK